MSGAGDFCAAVRDAGERWNGEGVAAGRGGRCFCGDDLFQRVCSGGFCGERCADDSADGASAWDIECDGILPVGAAGVGDRVGL